MDIKLIEDVKYLRNEGDSFGTIAKKLLISKSNARYYYNINLEDYKNKMLAREKYINDVCKLAKKCTNINQILRILGKKGTNEYYNQIKKILADNNIDTSHFVNGERFVDNFKKPVKPLAEYLVSGATTNISKLREKLLKKGVKEHKCENPECGLSEWHGKPIPLQLHHINGDRTDNRLENLQLLCPNCHAMTDNYCGKNTRKETNKCKICGKEIKTSSVYCEECYHNHIQSKNGFVEKPTDKELIDNFKELGSFRGICKRYGVSHKKVENWFGDYGLPTSSLEMRKYIRDKIDPNAKWKFTPGHPEVFREYQKNNFKHIGLLNDDSNVEKIYYSVEELVEDGFNPKTVQKVCRGELKAYHKRVFRYL